MTTIVAPVRVRNLPKLIVLSHLRWDFVTQRPQHLLTRAARSFDVIFVEEPVWVENGEVGVEAGIRPGGVRLVQPVLPWGSSDAVALRHQKQMLDTIVADAAGSEIVLWYYTPMALQFSRHLAVDVVVFDKMDELSAFQNASPLLVALEAELLERADIVFTGGASMHEATLGRHPNIHCFPSSIDAEHFAQARSHGLDDPADQQTIAHPRIGFFGVIDERMDLELVAAVADLRPEWQLVMIGPTAKIDTVSLPQRANTHWLGSKKYAELPAYLSGWDIGWMPFAINAATRFISPTKTPEFLAAGLPVVSTPIRDVIRPYGAAGVVEIAATAATTVAAIEELMQRPREQWQREVDKLLAQGSWDRTWAAMRGMIWDSLTPARAVAAGTREEARV
jgi:glycosyltransferase involved in cell wall biosynthesis